jgi:hypothetical protein
MVRALPPCLPCVHDARGCLARVPGYAPRARGPEGGVLHDAAVPRCPLERGRDVGGVRDAFLTPPRPSPVSPHVQASTMNKDIMMLTHGAKNTLATDGAKDNSGSAADSNFTVTTETFDTNGAKDAANADTVTTGTGSATGSDNTVTTGTGSATGSDNTVTTDMGTTMECDNEGCKTLIKDKDAHVFDCNGYQAPLCAPCHASFCNMYGDNGEDDGDDDKGSATNSDTDSATDEDTGDNCKTCDKFCKDGNYVVTDSWPGSYFCGDCYFEVSPEVRELSDEKKDKFCKILYELYIK